MDLRLPFAMAALLSGLLMTPSAHAASCEEKLAELDRLIAGNEDLSEANLEPVRMMRDMGARQCEKGNSAAANPILDIQIRNLRERAEQVEAQKARTIPKSELTPAYLEGDWCVSHLENDGTLRRKEVRIHFYPDGSFHFGIPPTYRLDTSSDPRPHERFLDQDHQVLIRKEPDEFRVELHGSAQSIHRRGGC